jgi:hypothetical protein
MVYALYLFNFLFDLFVLICVYVNRNSVLNCEVKKAYDKTKSPMENLKAFGLDPEINHFNSRSTPQTSSVSPEDVPKGQSKAKLAAFVGMGVVSGSDGIRLINKKRSDTVMSDFER